MAKKWVAIGSILAMLSVLIGAFGAHIIEPIIGEERLTTYETGVQYHMMHALGILLIALLANSFGPKKALDWAARLLLIGIILFSGSLYVLSMTGIGILGAITPLGGICFIIGWILVVVSVLKK
ncbi:DUF423 domain-containing protein [Paenibacillus urinalis]|uniref:DUF423 domain-containing protein n=2 Tax=Paenibacillus TaxID=44249 RepID=A0AAX3N6E3_9BACL|nr:MULTISPECIES: DUF423 domain-containing protein [Paenibacillus]WDH84232.1 DUF423 domain-containing protein [Paenibacillus urinalis]WDH95675.1 DUF423 domain-containing protein [Paenibacillus urinalis]WDI03872.1 DUF423 domain-containing protein [Paenibacillus urinalis]GAK38783.1 hypothetical protein TCA2_0509 [Paenibacillus sp. TCA20]